MKIRLSKASDALDGDPLEESWHDAFAPQRRRHMAGLVVSLSIMAAGLGFIFTLQNLVSEPAPTEPSSPVSRQMPAQAMAATASNPDNNVQSVPVATNAAPQKVALEKIAVVSEPAQSPEPQTPKPRAQEIRYPANYWGPRLKPTPNAQRAVIATNAPTLIASHDTAPTAPTPYRAMPTTTLAKPLMADQDLLSTEMTTSDSHHGEPMRLAAALSDDQPVPVFFASDITPNRIAPAPAPVFWSGDLPSSLSNIALKLQPGETLVDAMRRVGIARTDRNMAVAAMAPHIDLRRLQPNQEFELVAANLNQTVFQAAETDLSEQHLLAVEFRLDKENRLTMARNQSGDFAVEKHSVPIRTETRMVQGRIAGSLFQSAQAKGTPHAITAALANMFAYDVDFQRDIFGGDEYQAVFEVNLDDEDNVVGVGNLLYGRLNWRGRRKEKSYYHFAGHQGADYFDGTGKSAKRLLMKTPIDGARLSSGFGTRKHPILGYKKAHKGVDFAAPRGTPIYAAGDGVIERANRFGSFGNYVRIRHGEGYKTAYAHLKSFRRGIRAGKRVRQGDIIGYVGTTGRSTGPHLHYEVHHHGKAVNPQRLKIATGTNLKGTQLANFKKVRDQIDAHLSPLNHRANLLAKDDTPTTPAL